MKRRTAVFLCVSIFVIGLGGGFVFFQVFKDSRPSRWFALNEDMKERLSHYSFSDNYIDLDKSKIFPGFKTFNIRSRFIPSVKGNGRKFQLGYIIEFSLDQPLGSAREYDTENATSKDLAQMGRNAPPDRIDYEMFLDFQCLDGNGFLLCDIKSGVKKISSGESYNFQDLTSDQIPLDVVKRIKKVVPNMVLIKGMGTNKLMEKSVEEWLREKGLLDKKK